MLDNHSQSNNQPGLVIIGAGLAGYHTAKQWRLLNPKKPLTIITEHDGHFYSKPQLSTLQAKGKHPEALITKTAAQMAEDLNAIVLTNCSVAHIDAANKKIQTNNASSPEISYDQLVLATGAVVHQLPVADSIAKQLYSINHLEDYTSLQTQLAAKPDAKIVIIGSGLVGCELANDFIQAGHSVTVISNESYVMGRQLPKELAHTFQKACAAEGIQFIFEAQIQDITEQLDGFDIHYNDKTVYADIIISAIGFKPNIKLAAAAGLDVNHGIIIDNQFRTSKQHVFAIGDCAVMQDQWRPYIAPILQGGKVLGKVLSGEDVVMQYPVMPVIAKTPFCKVQGVFDRPDRMQQYQLTIDPSHQKAFYHNAQGELKAFVLCGDAVQERADWVKKTQP